MNDELMDDFFRNKLKNYSAPVPPHLWEKIINDKQKKPKVFWLSSSKKWLGIAAFFILMAGSISLYFFTTTKTSIIEQNTTHKKNIQPAPSNLQSLQVIPNKQTNQTNSNAENAQQHPQLNTTNTNPYNQALVNTYLSSGKDKTTKNTFTENITTPTNRNTENKVTSDQQITDKNYWHYNKVQAFPSFKNSLLYNTNALHLPPLNLRRILGLDACPNANGNQRNDWYIELYGAPNYTFKSMISNGISANYLQKKDSSEHMKGGFTFGARFSKTIGTHTYLKLGLQYSQVNELFNQRKEDQTQTTTVIVRRTITTPQGTTTVIDTSSVTQIGYRVIRSMNHYKNVELPIMIGYEFGLPDANWRITINGGLIFDLSSWYMGETLDTSLQVVSINSKSNNGAYQHSFNTSLYGSLGIYRRISDQMDVFAEPYFRYNILGTNSLYGVNQRFGAVGLNIGTRILLNGRRQHL
jgi:hypothetical protein